MWEVLLAKEKIKQTGVSHMYSPFSTLHSKRSSWTSTSPLIWFKELLSKFLKFYVNIKYTESQVWQERWEFRMDLAMEQSKASISWMSNNNKKVTQIYMQALFNLFLAFGRTLTLITTFATKFWIREFRDLLEDTSNQQTEWLPRNWNIWGLAFWGTDSVKQVW